MKPVLSRKAALLAGAMGYHLRPKLAQDATIDLPGIFKGVSTKNYKSLAPGLVTAITTALDGKLAKDASLADIGKVMDEMADVPMEEGLDTDPNSGLPMEAEALQKKVMGDADPKAMIQQLLTGKVDDATMAEVLKCLGAGTADPADPAALDADETPEEKAARMKKEGQAMDKKLAGFVSKEDAAKMAQDASNDAVKRVTDNLNAVQEARTFVRPWVGDIAIACDSAIDVYKAAAKAMAIDGVSELKEIASFQAIFKSKDKPGARKVTTEPALAADAASAKSFAERYPNASRIENLGK